MKKRNIIITCGVMAGLLIKAAWSWGGDVPKPAVTRNQVPLVMIAASDTQSAKDAAWKKALKRIEEADKAADAEVEKSLEVVRKLFADAKGNSKKFAGDLLTLKGKLEAVRSGFPKFDTNATANWLVTPIYSRDKEVKPGIGKAVSENLLKPALEGVNGNEYSKFLVERFESRFFKSDALQMALEGAVKAHVAALERIDNQLLVDLRADIEDSQSIDLIILRISGEDGFRDAYGKAKAQISPLLKENLKETVALEIISLAAGDVASGLTLRVGGAIATKMGVSVGILATGALGTIGTLGVSLVVYIVVDAAIDAIMKASGYNPEEKIAARVDEILDSAKDALIDGHPEAVGVHKLALKLATEASPAVRYEAAKTVQVIEKNGALGLKRELVEYTKVRNLQRRAALEQLLKSEKEALR